MKMSTIAMIEKQLEILKAKKACFMKYLASNSILKYTDKNCKV